MSTSHFSPNVGLSIAGFDCSAGAGVLADCRTFERLGVYGVSALTSVVAQSPGNVVSVQNLSSGLLVQQLDELIRSYPISAAKTGMLGSLPAIEAVSDFFKTHRQIPLVVDPVLSASTGVELTPFDLIDQLCARQFPLATLVTPNLNEAERILNLKIESVEEMRNAAEIFYQRFGVACLLKGGHFRPSDSEVCDVLVLGEGTFIFSDRRLEVPDLHGTGCSLSAAVAAHLAQGDKLLTAVEKSRSEMRRWMAEYHIWETPREVFALNAIED